MEENLKQFIVELDRQYNVKDNRGEFTSNNFKQYCGQNGFILEYRIKWYYIRIYHAVYTSAKW